MPSRKLWNVSRGIQRSRYGCDLRMGELPMVGDGHHTAVVLYERLHKVLFIFVGCTVSFDCPSLGNFEDCRHCFRKLMTIYPMA